MKGIRFKIVFIFLLITGVELSAQVNTLYYMTDIPQAYYLNPASQPKCNFFLGIPVITSYQSAYNSSVRLSDVFWNDPATGEVLHPLHPDASIDDFVAKFDDENYLNADISINIISFGFRVRQMYFIFDVTTRTKERLTYPDELVDFIFRGNANGATYNFGALSMNLTEHIEYGIGISRKFGDQLTVGIKPKILAGIAAMTWENSNISLFTSHEEWTLNSNLNVNMSAPGLIIHTDENGVMDFDRGFEIDSSINSVSGYKKIATGNLGFGIDIGVNYNPIDVLQISASVVDLGFIKWKNDAYKVSFDGAYSYYGAELTPQDSTFTFNILDSLITSFEPVSVPGSFKTSLEPKVFLGARFFLIPKFDLGFVSRFDFLQEGFKYNLTLMANYRPSSMFSITGSYSPLGGNAKSFGLGFSLRFGPLQVYVISDYLTSQYNRVNDFVLLNDIRNYSFRFGVNFVLGCNERKKLRSDKPMYYSDDY